MNSLVFVMWSGKGVSYSEQMKRFCFITVFKVSKLFVFLFHQLSRGRPYLFESTLERLRSLLLMFDLLVVNKSRQQLKDIFS